LAAILLATATCGLSCGRGLRFAAIAAVSVGGALS
jgi:hypothetical protein